MHRESFHLSFHSIRIAFRHHIHPKLIRSPLRKSYSFLLTCPFHGHLFFNLRFNNSSLNHSCIPPPLIFKSFGSCSPICLSSSRSCAHPFSNRTASISPTHLPISIQSIISGLSVFLQFFYPYLLFHPFQIFSLFLHLSMLSIYLRGYYFIHTLLGSFISDPSQNQSVHLKLICLRRLFAYPSSIPALFVRPCSVIFHQIDSFLIH